MRATLTSKCQFTLPAQIRDRLGLGPGDQLDLRLNDQGWIEMRPVRDATGSIWDLRGFAARLLHTLETRRRALGMTKAQLAEALDVAPSRVTEWTTGEVTPGLVAVGKWAHALGLTLDLTGGDAGAAA